MSNATEWVLLTAPCEGGDLEQVRLSRPAVLRLIEQRQVDGYAPIRRASDEEFAPLETFEEFAEALATAQERRRQQLSGALAVGRRGDWIYRWVWGGLLLGVLVAGILLVRGWVNQVEQDQPTSEREKTIATLRAGFAKHRQDGREAVAQKRWKDADEHYRRLRSVISRSKRYAELNTEREGAVKDMRAQFETHHIGKRARGLVLYRSLWLTPDQAAVRRREDGDRVLYKGQWVTRTERERLKKVASGLVPHAGKWFTRAEAQELKTIAGHLAEGEVYWDGAWQSPEAKHGRVRLDDGTTFVGLIEVLDPERMRVRVAGGAPEVIVRERIVNLEPTENPQHAFIRRYVTALTAQDVKALIALADRAPQRPLARKALERAKRLAPENVEVQRKLGQLGG